MNMKQKSNKLKSTPRKKTATADTVQTEHDACSCGCGKRVEQTTESQPLQVLAKYGKGRYAKRKARAELFKMGVKVSLKDFQ